MSNYTLIKVESLTKHFHVTRGIFNLHQDGAVQTVDKVSFEIRQGETLSLVGESSCGKSTTVFLILQIYCLTSGKVFFLDTKLTGLRGKPLRHISNRIAVMYLGKLVELATRGELYSHPLHPYTQALHSSIPIPDPIRGRKRHRIILKGNVPSSTNPPKGCCFHTRCPLAVDLCKQEEPEWREVASDHWLACLLFK